MAPRTAEQTQQLREKRRQQILTAALTLFAEQGLHHTKVSEIAKKAGVSQGTVYWYFDSKEALFEAAFMDQFDAYTQSLLNILTTEHRPAKEKLRDLATASIDLLADNPKLIHILLQIMSNREVARVLPHDFKAYYERFKVALVSLFEEIDDPDSASTAMIFSALLDGFMLQCLLGPEWFNRDQILAQIEEKFNL